MRTTLALLVLPSMPMAARAGWLSSILAMAYALSSHPASAQNECGPPTGGPAQVVCGDVTLNPFAGGISYETTTSLAVDVRSGIRIAPGKGISGVSLRGAGDGPLSISFGSGSSTITNGAQAFGLELRAAGTSSADITVGGDIDSTFNEAGPPGSPTTGAIVWITNSNSTAQATLTQSAGSVVTVRGFAGAGLYALQEGQGSIAMRISGEVHAAGDDIYGVNAFLFNSAATGTIGIVQDASSVVTTDGFASAGLYGITEGVGAASIVANGSIETRGISSEAVILGLSNGASSADAVVAIGDSADLITRGAESSGAFIFHSGLGATRLEHSGRIETFGSESNGLASLTGNVDNDALQRITLLGGASIRTHGDDSAGVRVNHSGGGTVDVALRGTSRISTTGVVAHGVALEADSADGATVRVAQEAGASISVTGAEAHGVSAMARDAASITVAGPVSATGEYGIGLSAAASAGPVSVDIAATSVVNGGWQGDVAGSGPQTGFPSAGLWLSSTTGAQVNNLGMVGAGSDRAIADADRGVVNGAGGALAIRNAGTITGFVEYAPVAGNSFVNAAGGLFIVRHFADTDGDGQRDTKRVAISDFGASSASFDNAGTVRLGATGAVATIDGAGYYIPTTGVNRRGLDGGVYSLARADIVQGQFVNMGEFNHSGILDLRGPSIGNSLIITGNATATAVPGGSVFVSNGGDLYLNALLNTGIAPGGNSNSQSDILIVDATRLGSAPTRVHVGSPAGSPGGLTTGNGIQLVEVLDKNASDAGAFALSGRVAAGAYEYGLFHNGVGTDGADGNWYLRNTVLDPAVPGGGGEFPNYRDEVPVHVALPAIAHRWGLDMLSNLHDRIGDDGLRRSGGSDIEPARGSALWGRAFGYHGDVGSNRGGISRQFDRFRKYGPSYDYDSLGFQLGVDVFRDMRPDGSRLAGGLYGGIGRIKGDVDAVYGGRSGRAKLRGYTLGGYWTHMGPSGRYLDVVVQATRHRGDVRTQLGDAFRNHGWGITASVEGGQSLDLGGDWTAEPQAQLVYQYLTLGGGQDRFARIDYLDSRTTFGRLGMRVARNWTGSMERRLSTSARFNVWHDFNGRAITRISTLSGQQPIDLATGLGGTWGQAQLMLTGDLTRSLSAFASGDYNFALDRSRGKGLGWRVGLKLRT